MVLGAKSLKNAGNELYREGEYLRAKMKYLLAVRRAEADGDTQLLWSLYSNLAQCCLHLDENREAFECATTCIRIAPGWQKGYYRAARAAIIMEEIEMAHDILDNGVLECDSSDSLLSLKRSLPSISQMRMSYARTCDLCEMASVELVHKDWARAITLFDGCLTKMRSDTMSRFQKLLEVSIGLCMAVVFSNMYGDSAPNCGRIVSILRRVAVTEVPEVLMFLSIFLRNFGRHAEFVYLLRRCQHANARARLPAASCGTETTAGASGARSMGERPLLLSDLPRSGPFMDNMLNVATGLMRLRMSSLVQHSRAWRPPHARCRLPNCQWRLEHVDEHVRRQVYLSDPDFKGLLLLQCCRGCRVHYHPACWARLKQQLQCSSDECVMGCVCVTPDCGGRTRAVSWVHGDGTVSLKACASSTAVCDRTRRSDTALPRHAARPGGNGAGRTSSGARRDKNETGPGKCEAKRDKRKRMKEKSQTTLVRVEERRCRSGIVRDKTEDKPKKSERCKSEVRRRNNADEMEMKGKCELRRCTSEVMVAIEHAPADESLHRLTARELTGTKSPLHLTVHNISSDVEKPATRGAGAQSIADSDQKLGEPDEADEMEQILLSSTEHYIYERLATLGPCVLGDTASESLLTKDLSRQSVGLIAKYGSLETFCRSCQLFSVVDHVLYAKCDRAPAASLHISADSMNFPAELEAAAAALAMRAHGAIGPGADVARGREYHMSREGRSPLIPHHPQYSLGSGGDHLMFRLTALEAQLRQREQHICALQLQLTQQQNAHAQLLRDYKNMDAQMSLAAERAANSEVCASQMQSQLLRLKQDTARLQKHPASDGEDRRLAKLALLALAESLLHAADTQLASVASQYQAVLNVASLTYIQQADLEQKLRCIETAHSRFRTCVGECMETIERGEMDCNTALLSLRPPTLPVPAVFCQTAADGQLDVRKRLGCENAAAAVESSTPDGGVGDTKLLSLHSSKDACTTVSRAASGQNKVGGRVSFAHVWSRVEGACGATASRTQLVCRLLEWRGGSGSLASAPLDKLVCHVQQQQQQITQHTGGSGDGLRLVADTHHCPICLDEFPHSQAQQVSCGHWLHNLCFRRWRRERRSNTTCPLCREVLVFEEFPAL